VLPEAVFVGGDDGEQGVCGQVVESSAVPRWVLPTRTAISDLHRLVYADADGPSA
jgi:hypothetical protein